MSEGNRLKGVLFPERDCPACERGEQANVPPANSIFPNPLPVHNPSGNICAKFIPQHHWDALLKAKAEREKRSAGV